MEKINNLNEKIYFNIQDQPQIKPPRIYVKSEPESVFELIRELALPQISYLSVIKIKNNGKDEFYFKLFLNYFSEIENGYKVQEIENKIKEVITDEVIIEKITKARIGQGKYRDKLLEQCPFCPITLVSDERVLIASHIKP